jgi:hypothetical protein
VGVASPALKQPIFMEMKLSQKWFVVLSRFSCPGEGLPPEMVQDMFHNSRWSTQEGLALSIGRKLLKLMSGEVQYIRESERCFFLIAIELPTSQDDWNMEDWFGQLIFDVPNFEVTLIFLSD